MQREKEMSSNEDDEKNSIEDNKNKRKRNSVHNSNNKSRKTTKRNHEKEDVEENGKENMEEDEKNKTKMIEKMKRTHLRKSYRKLIQDTIENKNEIIRPPEDGEEETPLQKVLKKADKLFKDVQETREGTLDSELLVLSSSLALEQAKKMQTHFNNYNTSDYIENCKRILQGERERGSQREGPNYDWSNLSEFVKKFTQSAPSLNFMFGTLNIVPKEKKKIVRKQKEKIEKKIVANETTEKQEIDGGLDSIQQVKRVHDYLKKASINHKSSKKDLEFFEFIFDPNSFTHTVENLFHLSFLVRDGNAKVAQNNSNEIIVDVSNPPSEDDMQRGLKRAQAVVRIDYKDWETLKSRNTSRKSIIPPNKELLEQESQRKPSQQSNKQAPKKKK